MSDVSTPFYRFAEGVLALKEKRSAAAIELLQSAATGLTPFTGGNPAIWMVIARIHANLALAHALAGDHDTALQFYRLAEPILTPHDTLELARCRDVLG
jgi:tetratricopeptide (TPR) repeat protein